MAGYVMKMSILVSNKNQCGQKDLSLKFRHKAYAARFKTINSNPALSPNS